MSQDFPTSPESITPAWLGELLDSKNELADFTSAPIGTGQVADSYRLKLNWQNKSPIRPKIESCVIKCTAADPASRATAAAMALYATEADWYRSIGTNKICRIPHCYFAAARSTDDSIAGDDDYLLVLEDCFPAHQISQMDGASVFEVELGLNEAAKLHAAFWNAESLAKHPSRARSQNNQNFVGEFLPQIYPEWRARYAGRLGADILEMGADLVARYADLQTATAAAAAPQTFTHGDFRLDNMLYPPPAGDNSRPFILDWQTVAVGSPMSDVAYFIATSIAAADIRADMEERLISDYLAALTKANPAAIYPMEAAMRDYRLAAFGGFIMAVISAMLVERTERGDEMFAVMAERSAFAALHLDSLACI